MSQVYGFCAQAGGVARIDSVPGEGTTVSLLLATANTADQGDRPAAGMPARKGIRVLLVDDDAAVIAATAPVLQSFGFDVATATDAQHAWRSIRDATPAIEVLLSDVTMSGERNGLDLARMLREQRPELPVVLMTGYTSELQRALPKASRCCKSRARRTPSPRPCARRPHAAVSCRIAGTTGAAER